MTVIKGDNGVIKIGKDFVEAAYLPRFAKCYKVEAFGPDGTCKYSLLVAAQDQDEAQRKVVTVLAAEGIKSAGAGTYQLAGAQ